jgi:hypothetical protein
MTIIRAPRPESNFYILDKRISEDAQLSWGARGMLVFLLGKPDHWKVNVEALVNETATSSKPAGKSVVYGYLTELLDAGYMTRRKHPTGQLDYLVHETPGQAEPDSKNPNLGKPNQEKPDQEKPDFENPPLVSIEEAVSKDLKQGKRAGTSRLSAAWTLTDERKALALSARPEWKSTPEFVTEIAGAFRSYYTTGSGANVRKPDWDIAWQDWVSAEKRNPSGEAATATAGDWWTSAAGIKKKGAELDLYEDDYEGFPYFKAAVLLAAGDGPWATREVRAAVPRSSVPLPATDFLGEVAA